MSRPDDPEHTFKPADVAQREQRPIPSLTILFHPDLDRIGQQARLTELLRGRPVELSRSQPAFAPAHDAGRPTGGLEDRHLSRKPIRLGWNAHGNLVLDLGENAMSVAVDGSLVAGHREISADQLARGVVIDLAERVVLLLHLLPAANAPLADLGLVGANPAMNDLRDNIRRVADLPVSVLIRGETGTGKELVARAIHQLSDRADRAFITVNMAAVPESTAAAELFGYSRGAFTGAVGDSAGYFAEATGGTLFLDEIGATPAAIQPMLLRVLESHEIQPLGSAKPRQIDVRLIAATDADLEQSTAEESFRAALLHRLEGYQLFLPPLRQRRDDIGRLVVHFLRDELAATGESHHLVRGAPGEPTWLPASLMGRLARLDWPGNVRQLRNLVRQLVISSRGADRARIDSAVTRLLTAAAGEILDETVPLDGPVIEPVPMVATIAPPAAGSRSPADVTDQEMAAALRTHDWQVNRAATALGISRSSLYERMRASSVIRLASDLGRGEIEAAWQACDHDLDATARRLEVSKRALSLRMKELGLDRS